MSSGPPGGGTWTGVAITVGGIVALLVVALAIPPLREAIFDAVGGDTAQVREDLRNSPAGILLVFGLAVVHAVVWYPAEILDAATGYVYGFGPGLALVHVSWIVSGILAYEIGRHLGRPLLYRFVGEKRFRRLEDLIEGGGAGLLLACRLVPIVPFSLTGYVAGAAHVPRWRYLWTTAVGFLPITAYFVYLGSRLEEFSLEDPILWIGGIVFVVAIFGIRYVQRGLSHREAERG